jgi:PAS domain S-box-containing protein
LGSTIDDPQRLAALELVQRLDASAGESFDRWTRLAARLLSAPAALVSLVGEGRQLVTSLYGVEGGPRELAPACSLCRRVVEADAPLFIEDGSGLAEGYGVAAYAGFPLRAPDGYVLGTLCVYDTRPRCWSDEDRQTLADLAGAANGEIAQRVRMAEQSRSEAHYRRLVTASPFPIYALDAEGRFVELNHAAEALLGRESAAVMGTHFALVIAPEDLPSTAEVFTSLMGGVTDSAKFEIDLVRPSGERRRASITVTTIREEERITGVHGIARDITEEVELLAEMRLLHLALASLSQGVSITDEDGRVIFVNRAYQDMLGLEGEAGAQAYLDELLRDPEAAAEDEAIRGAVREAGEWSGLVWRTRADDGRRVPLDMFVGEVYGPGGRRCHFCIVQDAGERLARDRHLRRTERLAGLGTLVGGVAHELNNPLTAIKGFSSMMLMDVRGEADREALEVMKREADRAAQIVANLRRLARDTQEDEIPRGPVDLNEVIGHVLQVRAYTLGTHNIEFDADLDPDLPPVSADRGQMEQVLLNLVVNAEQALAGRPGPRITLTTRATERGAALAVSDNGHGIPEDQVERIFDPFYTTKAPGEGTGLGLSLVHGIVADHGGRVHVDSVVGEGTTFRIDFPAASVWVAEEAPPGPDPFAPAPEPLRVLVVDDEDSIRRTLLRYLTRRGHRVSVASEGGEALRLLEAAEDGFDVILSDMRMPGLSGERLYASLRERADGMDRRLVFMSGDALGETTAEILAATAVPVILKPFDLASVADTLESVGRQR